MTPAISVVLPVRNAAATIEEAVDSILRQDFGDFECWVVDDGSTDDTPRILARYSDHRLRVLSHPEPHGVAEAMQFGVDQARASWVARMDADDVSHPERLGMLMEWAMRHPDCAALKSRVRLIEGLGDGMDRHVAWVNGLETPESIACARFIESPIAHPSSMIRKDWLQRIGGYRAVEWAEDHDVWMRLLEAGGQVISIPNVLVDWRDSSTRLTRADARYGEAARSAMRCHYLARLPEVMQRGVAIAGAGPIGKSISRGLNDLGVKVQGFFEVHPRRIGQTIHGVPVLSSERMAEVWTDAVVLGAVGIPGGRERVRQLAMEHGRVEGRDFWSVC